MERGAKSLNVQVIVQAVFGCMMLLTSDGARSGTGGVSSQVPESVKVKLAANAVVAFSDSMAAARRVNAWLTLVRNCLRKKMPFEF